MQSLVLHIGTHKTGSTSLQSVFARSREALLKVGVLYPVEGCPQRQHRFGHHLLAWGIQGRRGTPESHWNAFLEEVARTGGRAETVVVSSESFDRCGEAEIARIAAYLADFDVRVVVYLRNQRDFMVSQYKQYLKNGRYFPSFRHFLEENVDRCYYGRLLDRWIDGFGRDRVVVRMFDRVKRDPGLEQDFVSLLPVESSRMDPVLARYRKQNASPPNEVMNWIRTLNWLEQTFGSGPRNLIGRARTKARRSAPRQGPWRGIAKLAFGQPLYDESDVQWLRESLADHNAVLFEKHVGADDHAYLEF